MNSKDASRHPKTPQDVFNHLMNEASVRSFCGLTECCFNSHDNLRFDEFGEPLGPAFCTAKNDAEVFSEQGHGVPDECPILSGLDSLDEEEEAFMGVSEEAEA